MSTPVLEPNRLRDFVVAFSRLLDGHPGEAEIIERGKPLLRALLAADDWLPEAFALPHPGRYQRYLLHMDSSERFSVISVVWGPGQRSPIHNHATWGLVGVLRGAEWAQVYEETPDPASGLGRRFVARGFPTLLSIGEVDAVSPTLGDLHEVSNAFNDKVTVSIHVYGANVGQLEPAIFTENGEERPFVSGYANRALPNIWQLAGVRADSIGLPRVVGLSSAEDVRQALLDKREICLMDVREPALHVQGHPLFAVNLPLSRLELDVHSAIPRRDTCIVVIGDTEGSAETAATRLMNWGYSRVTVLLGGIEGWRVGGGELFSGLHAPSRAFAVLVAQAHRNGTIALGLDTPPPTDRQRRRTQALRAGVRMATLADVLRMQSERHRTTYLFDIRSAQAYEAGHMPGARRVDPSELIERTEVHAPVRGARIVLIDGTPDTTGDPTAQPCALTAASWLAQMAIETHVFESMAASAFTRKGRWRVPVPAVLEALPALPSTSVAQLRECLAASDHTAIIDVGPGERYEREHLPGARFVLRSRLMRDLGALPRPARYVFTADDPMLAALAAADVARETRVPVSVLSGGLAAWKEAGLAVESGFAHAASPMVDSAPPASGDAAPRNVDDAEASSATEWEFDLVERLARDGTHGFRLV